MAALHVARVMLDIYLTQRFMVAWRTWLTIRSGSLASVTPVMISSGKVSVLTNQILTPSPPFVNHLALGSGQGRKAITQSLGKGPAKGEISHPLTPDI